MRGSTVAPQIFAEVVATLGLHVVILEGIRHRPECMPITVGCYINAAYWFMALTSFANRAVTLARSFLPTALRKFARQTSARSRWTPVRRLSCIPYHGRRRQVDDLAALTASAEGR